MVFGGLRVIDKPFDNLKNIVSHVKDKIPIEFQSNVVYQIECGECDMSYVGETKRRLRDRKREHVASVTYGKVKFSALASHHVDTNHVPNWESVKILDRDSNWLARRFKESFHILNTKDILNRDEGVNILTVYTPLLTKNVSKFAKKDGIKIYPAFSS